MPPLLVRHWILCAVPVLCVHLAVLQALYATAALMLCVQIALHVWLGAHTSLPTAVHLPIQSVLHAVCAQLETIKQPLANSQQTQDVFLVHLAITVHQGLLCQFSALLGIIVPLQPPRLPALHLATVLWDLPLKVYVGKAMCVQLHLCSSVMQLGITTWGLD